MLTTYSKFLIEFNESGRERDGDFNKSTMDNLDDKEKIQAFHLCKNALHDGKYDGRVLSGLFLTNVPEAIKECEIALSKADAPFRENLLLRYLVFYSGNLKYVKPLAKFFENKNSLTRRQNISLCRKFPPSELLNTFLFPTLTKDPDPAIRSESFEIIERSRNIPKAESLYFWHEFRKNLAPEKHFKAALEVIEKYPFIGP